MNKSESIAKIADALCKAQSSIKNAVKDSDNPFFKSKYADLASVRDACQESLSANGLAYAQFPENREGKLVLTTILMHTSGEWLSGELEMTPTKSDPQGIGSAITYARRYALAAVTGVATEDDDGNSASGNKPTATTAETRTFGKPKAEPELAKFNAEHPPILTGVDKYADKGQIANFCKEFRLSLTDELRPNAEILRHEWLGIAGYVDNGGNPTATMIPKADFVQARDRACEWAKGKK